MVQINENAGVGGSGVRPWRVVRPGLGLGLLTCLFAFFLVVLGVVMPLLGRVFARPEAAVRIGAVVQDLFLFIVPAVGTAVVVTRLPARLLAIDRLPSFVQIMLAVVTLCAAIPLMNFIVDWNEHLTFGSAFADFEAEIRALEQQAQATVNALMGGAGVGSLVVSVLIMGVLTGLAEELFFRGALQRLLGMLRGFNPHAAIWLTAFVFSFVHFQFFGFVPRLLLGAFFGYALYWSGSLWLPVLLHMLNNSIVVVTTWKAASAAAASASASPAGGSLMENGGSLLETVGAAPVSAADWSFIVVSAAITAAGLWMLRRSRI